MPYKSQLYKHLIPDRKIWIKNFDEASTDLDYAKKSILKTKSMTPMYNGLGLLDFSTT
jgi:hypothetical protein